MVAGPRPTIRPATPVGPGRPPPPRTLDLTAESAPANQSAGQHRGGRRRNRALSRPCGPAAPSPPAEGRLRPRCSGPPTRARRPGPPAGTRSTSPRRPAARPPPSTTTDADADPPLRERRPGRPARSACRPGSRRPAGRRSVRGPPRGGAQRRPPLDSIPISAESTTASRGPTASAINGTEVRRSRTRRGALTAEPRTGAGGAGRTRLAGATSALSPTGVQQGHDRPCRRPLGGLHHLTDEEPGDLGVAVAELAPTRPGSPRSARRRSARAEDMAS